MSLSFTPSVSQETRDAAEGEILSLPSLLKAPFGAFLILVKFKFYGSKRRLAEGWPVLQRRSTSVLRSDAGNGL